MAEGVSRRNFLKKLGWGSLAVAGTAVLGRKGLELAGKAATELEPSYDPSEVYAGEVEVLKGVHVRKSPNTEEPNVVDWDNIEEINGVKLGDAGSFTVLNPKIYSGFDPSASRGGHRDSPWIELEARIKKPLTGSYMHRIYVNMGSQTYEFVKIADGTRPFLPLQKDQNGQLTATGHGIILSASQIGIVSVNSPK